MNSTPNWGHTASGLIGFGPSSSYAIPPWWAGVIDTWPEKRFGLFVGRTADWETPSPLAIPEVPRAGSVTLGGVDPALFVGELASTPSNLTKWWTVGLDGVRVNGAPIAIDLGLESAPYGEVGGKASAMLDTGLSVLVGPSVAVERIYAAISGAFTPDNETYFLPLGPEARLEFCFAGACWAATLLDASDCRPRAELLELFVEQVVQAEREGVTADTWCSGTLIPDAEAGQEFPQWSLGDAFLQNHYVAHQFEPAQIQIAPLSSKAREMVKEANIGINRVLGS